MKKINHYRLEGSHGKPVMLDAYFKTDGKPKPVLVFLHGFKGFKDWGHWSLLGEKLAEAGFVFLKFNFSHNGTTPDKPLDFADLEAFGNNNFEKEMADLKTVLDWLFSDNCSIPNTEINLENITLVGHSRGGPIAILTAKQDARVSQVITLASVQQLDYGWQNASALAKWREKGVNYIWNSRTLQEMPLYFQLYENFLAHEKRFDVKSAVEGMKKPFLVLHGDQDPAVPLSAAEQLNRWSSSAQLEVIQGANHVFGGKHPYESTELPKHSLKITEHIIQFLSIYS